MVILCKIAPKIILVDWATWATVEDIIKNKVKNCLALYQGSQNIKGPAIRVVGKGSTLVTPTTELVM